MYNNPYINNNLSINERIDNEIEKLKQMKANMQPVQPITQNFQLAPHSGIRYVNTIDEVKREIVYGETPFFSKDLTVLWVKNSKGDIKAYELKQIIEKDEKDLQIEYLQQQIEQLKGMITNEQHNANDNRENVSTSTSNSDETVREQTENDKSSIIQRISTSKKKQY